MASVTGIAIGVLVVTLLYRYIVYPALLSPLPRIPNAHWSVPILPTWIQRERRLGAENRTIYSLHERLGSVVRLAPNELSVNSADALRTVYTGAFEKDEWYRDAFINFGVDNLVSTMAFTEHSEQKRILSKVYSKSYLQHSLDLQKISSLILSKRLLPLLDNAARDGHSINVYPLFEAVGMDFVSAYLFGTARGTNYLHDAHSWDNWLKSYDAFKLQSPKARRGGYLERWCLSLCENVEHSAATTEEGKDEEEATEPVVYGVLSHGLKQQKKNDQRPRQLAVASELLDHLIAGHETSGITFTYLMWQLSRHPKMQADLRQELLTLSPSFLFEGSTFTDSSSSSSCSIPSAQSIDSLPLLDAVVRETLRLHAAAPGPLPRVAPSSPQLTVIDGYSIPPGVRVSSSVYALHRNADVFPQPTKWLPGRWLDSTPEKLSDMRRLFMVFGRGGRMCLGSNFALQEIKLVVAALYTNYITAVTSDDGMEQEDAFIAPPIGRELMLQFKPAGDEA